MQITLSNPRGFCAGVRMAIEVVDQLLDVMDPNEPLYVYHEIVHNRHVVDRLREKGAIFVDDLDDVPEDGVVVFSAHGVSPEIREHAKNKKLVPVDATCPLVTKVHAEAVRYAKRGWQILLIGHNDHQEIIGTYGEAPESTQIVGSPEDIPHLKIDDPNKLVYLTQTTLSVDDADLIISALKSVFPNIHAPPSDDICYATTNRQFAVRDEAPDVDLVLVVGSDNSSNSVRLTEISKSAGTPAYLLDDSSTLDPSWLEGVQSVLITAGASAPEHLVLELINYLIEHHDGQLTDETVVDEGIAFSMPASFNKFVQNLDVTIEGQTK